MMTFGEYSAFLRGSLERLPAELATASAEIAENAAIEARSMIGHRQDNWPDLALSTKARKEDLGFSPPDYQPLLRTGEMRDSIKWLSTSLGGVIGSDSKVMFWHEFGTKKMQPRPVLGQALLRSIPLLEQILGEVAVRSITPL